MSTVWVVAILLASAASGAAPAARVASPAAAAADQPLVKPRTGAELRHAADDSLRRWAKLRDQQTEQAAREFLVLYDELRRDDQLPRGEREQLSAKVCGRLSSLAQQLQRRAAIEKRQVKSDPTTWGLSRSSGSENGTVPLRGARSVDTAGQRGAVLSQWGVRGGQPGGMGLGGPAPAGPGGYGAFGGMAADDNSQELVELIQRTIAPYSWDVNGGNGSIYYWRPGRALAVRASDEVHEEIGGVLEQLQRAGR